MPVATPLLPAPCPAAQASASAAAFRIIAGPCAIESLEQFLAAARAVKAAGADALRGGAYKPRSSPYSFQGLGAEGLALAAEAKRETGLPFVTELVDVRDLERVLAVADEVQVGTHNMRNHPLLSELGCTRVPIILKRGIAATMKDLMNSLEYILGGGNDRVTLCERGIRTCTETTRYTLDLGAVAWLKAETDLPVIVDPSHAAGRADLVLPLARAAAAVGADGLLIETHPNPAAAECDGPQQIPTSELPAFVHAVDRVVAATRGGAGR